MTDKENAIRIIRFDNPSRVVQYAPSYYIRYMGSAFEGYDGRNDSSYKPGECWRDVFGIMWQKEQAGVMGFPRVNPIADLKDYKSYIWPDPDDERICGRIYKDLESFPDDRENRFLCGDHRSTLWEKAYFLVGMENLMMYFNDEPGYVREVLHRITDFNIGIARHYIKCGIEIAGLGDDLGTQRGMLFSPGILREFFVPEYKRLIELYKKKHTLISFHSCGHIEPAIDDLAELGVDILNPVQATANDLGSVRKKTAGKITLQGGISSALIMHGSTDDIECSVKYTIKLLGKDGGYFCTADQGLPFPGENIRALADAVEKYGKYPLNY